MSVLLSCPQGHRWVTTADRIALDTCPICGATGGTITQYDASRSTEICDELPPPPRAPAKPSIVASSNEKPSDFDEVGKDSATDVTAWGDGFPAELPNPFGRYEVIRRLGSGGMGTVYLARDVKLDRQVAIKVPRFTDRDTPHLLERFQREVEDRYASMREFADALTRYLDQGSPHTTADRAQQASRITNSNASPHVELVTELLERLAARSADAELEQPRPSSTQPHTGNKPVARHDGRAAGMKLQAFGCSLQIALVTMAVLLIALMIRTNVSLMQPIGLKVSGEVTEDEDHPAKSPTIAGGPWDQLVPVATLPAAKLVFVPASDELTRDSKEQLDELANHLTGKDYYALITGTASRQGDVEQNKSQADQRAQAVRKHLIAQGVEPSRLRVANTLADEEMSVTMHFFKLRD